MSSTALYHDVACPGYESCCEPRGYSTTLPRSSRALSNYKHALHGELEAFLVGDLCRVVLDFLCFLPRPFYVPRPLPMPMRWLDDRDDDYSAFGEDLVTLPGL